MLSITKNWKGVYFTTTTKFINIIIDGRTFCWSEPSLYLLYLSLLHTVMWIYLYTITQPTNIRQSSLNICNNCNFSFLLTRVVYKSVCWSVSLFLKIMKICRKKKKKKSTKEIIIMPSMYVYWHQVGISRGSVSIGRSQVGTDRYISGFSLHKSGLGLHKLGLIVTSRG